MSLANQHVLFTRQLVRPFEQYVIDRCGLPVSIGAGRYTGAMRYHDIGPKRCDLFDQCPGLFVGRWSSTFGHTATLNPQDARAN